MRLYLMLLPALTPESTQVHTRLQRVYLEVQLLVILLVQTFFRVRNEAFSIKNILN